MAQLPVPVRAALGLAASVADALKDGRGRPDGFTEGLADKALELPVLAVSTALQLSLRAQQQYAAMTVRGDELLTQLRGGPPVEPPEWAQFDDEPAEPDPAPTAAAPAANQTPVKNAPAKKATATKATAKKAPAKGAAAKRAPAKNAPVKKAAAKKAAATQAATALAAPAMPAPRTGKPSAFDLVGGDQP